MSLFVDMRKAVHVLMLLLVLSMAFGGSLEAKKRRRPDSMRHSESDVENMRKITPVVCSYVSNGHRFAGDVYATGEAGAIKIGRSTLTFKGGRYTLAFKGSNFQMRDVLTPRDKWKFNPWRSEQLCNDFNQTGKFETFHKAGRVYLRLYDGNSSDYITDIPLGGKSVKSFAIDEEGLLFEFTLY